MPSWVFWAARSRRHPRMDLSKFGNETLGTRFLLLLSRTRGLTNVLSRGRLRSTSYVQKIFDAASKTRSCSGFQENQQPSVRILSVCVCVKFDDMGTISLPCSSQDLSLMPLEIRSSRSRQS